MYKLFTRSIFIFWAKKRVFTEGVKNFVVGEGRFVAFKIRFRCFAVWSVLRNKKLEIPLMRSEATN